MGRVNRVINFLCSETMNTIGLVLSAVFGAILIVALLFASDANAQVSQPPAPPVPAVSASNLPPGWIRTDIPDVNGNAYIRSVAVSWCEGTTRVHTLSSADGSSSGGAQDIEPNAKTCGGTGQ